MGVSIKMDLREVVMMRRGYSCLRVMSSGRLLYYGVAPSNSVFVFAFLKPVNTADLLIMITLRIVYGISNCYHF